MSKGQSLQEPFLNALRREHIPVSVYLVNGIKLQGQIESFDQFVILLKNTVSQMVYKHAISTVVPSRNVRLPKADDDDDEDQGKPKGKEKDKDKDKDKDKSREKSRDKDKDADEDEDEDDDDDEPEDEDEDEDDSNDDDDDDDDDDGHSKGGDRREAVKKS